MVAKSTGIVMAGVLLSRILGFVREWTVAHQMGSNAATDAFYAAFTLPDFLNYLVAAGSLSVTFIPVFAKYVAEGKEDEGWHVFSTVVTFMGLAVTALVIAGEIWAGKLVSAIVPGFNPAEKERVVFLTRIMLPAQICFYEGSILSAVQYAKNQFVIPSLAPLIYNIGIILGGVLLASRIGMTGFAVGVLGGAIAGNFLLQIYGATRAGSKYRPSLDLRHPGFKMFIKLAIPIMLALSLSFTDDWIIRWFGSYLQPAAITWLSYAKTLMRVPLGVAGQAVGVASFPVMATLYSEKKFDRIEQLAEFHFEGADFPADSDFGADDCGKLSAGLPGFFAHEDDGGGFAGHGGDIGVFFDRDVCVGSAEYSGAGILFDAQYDDSRDCGDFVHGGEFAFVLVAGAARGAFGTGAGQFAGNYFLYGGAVCFVEPADGE